MAAGLRTIVRGAYRHSETSHEFEPGQYIRLAVVSFWRRVFRGGRANFMKPVEAMVVLMCAVVGVVLIGGRLKIPYPIALVIGGLAISLVPGLPVIRINPELVFLLFLPPLLYAAAWFTSWHEFKANLRPIFLLAFCLVLFTTVVVGLVLHGLVPAVPL